MVSGYWQLSYLAAELELPYLHTLMCEYLRARLDPDNVNGPLPYLSSREKIGVHLSASVTFYAPTELCGPRGMHREYVRCVHSWFGQGPRYDTVLVTTNPDTWGMQRFRVAQVVRFLSFKSVADGEHNCALVMWFTTDEDRDPLTGMWVVRPELLHDTRVTSVIPLSSIARACHLMPVLENTHIPVDFPFSDTLMAFQAYYVNPYIDYHSHEMLL